MSGKYSGTRHDKYNITNDLGEDDILGTYIIFYQFEITQIRYLLVHTIIILLILYYSRNFNNYYRFQFHGYLSPIL